MYVKNLKPGAALDILKGQNIVINRCLAIGKQNGDFNFYPACNMMPNGNRAKMEKIRKKSIKVEIMNIKSDGQLRGWKKLMEGIVAGTCYQYSKAYTDRYGIVSYYLNVSWATLELNHRRNEDYIVPPPKGESND